PTPISPRSRRRRAPPSARASGDRRRTVEARRWLYEQVGAGEMAMAMHELEGFDEIMQKFIMTLPPEQRLAGLPPEQRLAGLSPEQVLAALPPEQRLAGLPPEQAVLAMPD